MDLVTSMRGCLHVLAAVLDPLDRSSDFHRDPWNQQLFGIDRELCAKTTPDLGRDDPHRGLR